MQYCDRCNYWYNERTARVAWYKNRTESKFLNESRIYLRNPRGYVKGMIFLWSFPVAACPRSNQPAFTMIHEMSRFAKIHNILDSNNREITRTLDYHNADKPYLKYDIGSF